MTYRVTLANGDTVFHRDIDCVSAVNALEDVYILRDATGTVLFTAPFNYVVCIESI